MTIVVVAPAAIGGLQHAEPDRAGAEHQHRRAEQVGRAARRVDGDRHRLGERRLDDAQAVGHDERRTA